MDVDEQAKQYAIADFDLMWCQRYLVAYIELMTLSENPESDPWLNLRSREFGRDHNFLDILGRSLVTAVVISYSRPWSNNRGPAGRLRLPNKLFSDMAQLLKREDPEDRLLPFDHDVHKKVLGLRDKIVAHSDHSEWSFEIASSRLGTETTLKDPFTYLTLEAARQLLANTQSLRSEMNEYRRKALALCKA
ncbi:hypothetical protein [Thiobaca trueperi]|uniref:hypothetical protein n=1 Tax=Thiobaca trueperi TaxID=127458 RepID=UPI001047CCA1|nr:hypothetical protein [Thiobaca trueperi]